MVGKAAFGLLFAAGMAVMVYRVAAPARAIWKGDTSRVPLVPRIQPGARVYVPYLVWFALLFGGLGLTMLSGAVGLLVGPVLPVRACATIALPMFFIGVAMTPVLFLVWFFNRPRFLITPAYRHDPGPFAKILRWLRRR